MDVHEFLSRLEGVTGGGGQWHARCPAHDDHQASLSVAIGRDGRILVRCHAGCVTADVVHAAGYKLSDLFASGNRQRSWSPRPLAEAIGALLPSDADIARWRDRLLADQSVLARIHELKGWTPGALGLLDIGLKGSRLTIPVRTPIGELVAVHSYWPEAQPKMIAAKGRPRTPLYYMPDPTAPVWIVEGETDAVSMVCMSLNVIGAPGASAKAHANWLDVVRGRTVYVCFDIDSPGERAAQRWARTAHNRSADVHVIELDAAPESHYDVSDLLLEHGPDRARRMLLELAAQAPVWAPPTVATIAPPTPHDEVVAAAEPGTIITRSLATITPARIRMLWRDRIPRGRVGIVFGSPGEGKSTLMALLTAEITARGGRVVIATAEDNANTALVPRMIAAGADLALADVITTKAGEGETTIVLPRDLRMLGELMRRADLLIIDPLNAHLGDDVDTNRDQSVRAHVVAPLIWYAERADCAVVLIGHTNKSDRGDALSRITGSSGWGASVRFALLFGTHPQDVALPERDRRVVLAHVKASETARQATLVFRRDIVGIDHESGARAPLLELTELAASIGAEAVLEQSTADEQGAFGDAVEFLRRELADGPKLAKRLLAATKERGDFSERTLRRAKRSLEVKSAKGQEGWWWEYKPNAS